MRIFHYKYFINNSGLYYIYFYQNLFKLINDKNLKFLCYIYIYKDFNFVIVLFYLLKLYYIIYTTIFLKFKSVHFNIFNGWTKFICSFSCYIIENYNYNHEFVLIISYSSCINIYKFNKFIRWLNQSRLLVHLNIVQILGMSNLFPDQIFISSTSSYGD